MMLQRKIQSIPLTVVICTLVSSYLHRLDSFEFNGHFCLVMPLYGRSFYSVVKANDYKPFPLSLIRDLLREVDLSDSSHK